MTDKPTTPPAGEPTTVAIAARDRIMELHNSGEADGAYEAAIIQAAIDAHTATLRADFERRMGMSQHALGAALKARAEAQSKLAEAEKERDEAQKTLESWFDLGERLIQGRPISPIRALEMLEAKLTAAQAELAAERGKEAPVDVFWKRMAESGHSYDAKAGIWWSDDSKPGVLADLEAKLAATEAQLAEAHGYGSRLFKSLAPQCEPLDTAAGVFTQLDNWSVGIQRRVKAAEARVARCHRLLGIAGAYAPTEVDIEIHNELTAPPVVPE